MLDPVPEHLDGHVDIPERSELHGLIADREKVRGVHHRFLSALAWADKNGKTHFLLWGMAVDTARSTYLQETSKRAAASGLGVLPSKGSGNSWMGSHGNGGEVSSGSSLGS